MREKLLIVSNKTSRVFFSEAIRCEKVYSGIFFDLSFSDETDSLTCNS